MHKRNKEIERSKVGGTHPPSEETREGAYRKLKGIFFGIAFTDGTLQVRVLERAAAEFAAKGTELHHCVFSNSYFLKRTPLSYPPPLTAKRIETVEVS